MFKIGQKVVAVKPTATLVTGEIYKVALLSECACGLVIIGVEGISPRHPSRFTDCYCNREHKNYGYALYTSDRFRPIDEAFGENVAAAIEEQFQFITA